jgi:glycosyltransferase involved in cell wall biosynthesis
MRLCFLTGEYPPMQGGVADHTRHLAQHLAAMDVQVAILTSAKASPTSSSAGISVHPIIRNWRLSCWKRIAGFLAATRPDIVHIQYQAAAYDLTAWINWLPWRLRLGRLRPRVVVTFHDLRVPYIFPKAGPLRRWSVLALARSADAVITTNAEDEAALRRYPWATHVRRIPLGSNIEAQPPAGYQRNTWRQQRGVDDSRVLLAYFGFLNPSKGGEDVILVLDRLVRRGLDACLLMIGGQVGDVDATNRAYLEQVRALVRLHHLEDRVLWTGHVEAEEVSAALMAADVVVMPYRDGVSLRRTTFIAALRHGCAVVTTPPAVDVPELRSGDNLLLAPVGDVDAMAEAVAQVALDPALAARLRRGALALARTFDWPEIARRTRQVYRELGV